MSGEDLPRIMSDTALPPPPPLDPDLLALVGALLDQRPLNPALQSRYLDPEAVAARAARDARQRDEDWPDLARYRAANTAVHAPDLVMIGDSLTQMWQVAMPAVFEPAIVNRGIAGQTSPQILLRFMADVVDLSPRRVHILCGTNDIAGNTGPNTPEDYRRNVRAMVDLAVANGIEVLLASIPPAGAIFWQPDARPLQWIPSLNAWLAELAERHDLRFVDYHAALSDGHGALRNIYSADGVHVTRAGYRCMWATLAPFLDG